MLIVTPQDIIGVAIMDGALSMRCTGHPLNGGLDLHLSCGNYATGARNWLAGRLQFSLYLHRDLELFVSPKARI